MEIVAALNQQPLLLYVFLLLLGMTVGSFLNVVIYRIPAMIEREEHAYCTALLEGGEPPEQEPFNLATPGSRCPHCGHAIRPWENIPVISWLLLRGRCSSCQAGISIRYPLIEASCGALTVLLGLQFGGLSAALGMALLFTWALLALTMIDIDTMLLPDAITLPLMWLGLLVNLFGLFAPLQDAVIGAMAGYGVLWSVFWLFKLFTGKEGMGYGDFKLLAALGAWLGWQALPMIILLSSFVGAVLGILVMALQKRGKDVPIPFGPYLAIAGWIALVWGNDIMAWYWANFTTVTVS
ncbi:MAG: A24 family peptidase [Halieaceae bacterium]|jgi:leader peptidase (prepilin peptidase)/N-methyltransferase|nr:A24 family peptidase [Halieaceae bacterium]